MPNMLTIINMVLTIMLAIGGIMAFRSGFGKQASAAQADAIEAMGNRITTLTSEIGDLRRENHHLMTVQDIIIESLKKRGLILTIEKTSITIEDQTTRTTNITRIEEESK